MHCTNTPIRHFVSMNSIVWFGCETDLHFSSAIYLNSFLASDHIDAMTLGAIPFLRHCGNRQWDGNFVKATTRATSHTKSMNPSIMMNNFQRITFPSSVRFIQCDDAFVANSHASFEWHSNKKKKQNREYEKMKAKWNAKSQMKICYRFACTVLTFTRLTKRTRWCCGFSIAPVCHSITFSPSRLPRSAAAVSISMPILSLLHFNNFPNDLSECSEHRQPQKRLLRTPPKYPCQATTWGISPFTVLWIHVVDCLHCLYPAPNDSQITNLFYIYIHFGLSVSIVCLAQIFFHVFKYSFRISINFQW